MRKLTKGEQETLNGGLSDINKKYSQSSMLPEEKKLFDDESIPRPGYHVHNEDNPTGLHRHSADDKIDGAHRHTLLNPGGEHVHGEFEGMALIDGPHFHQQYSSLGYHHHKEKEQKFLLNKKVKLL